uniref:helix-turn-helix domain-containing protein n=1 Tax=Bifidobacterium adolescentis TaxID=1680 RepID=UPI00359C6CAF
MTATQVARILGVSTETLRKWRARRMCLPYVRVGRYIRYKAADVAAFVERGTVMPA